MNSEVYSPEELETLLGSVGEDVQIDRTVRLLGARAIHVGSHVRIDSYAVLVGGRGLRIGSHIHLAAGCQITASGAEVILEDFVGLSARCNVFAATDDYSSGALSNPTVPLEYRNPFAAPVLLRRHVLVGCGSVIMPGVTLGLGAAVGALSFVNKSVPDFVIASGNPLRKVGVRDGARLLELEERFLHAHRG